VLRSIEPAGYRSHRYTKAISDLLMAQPFETLKHQRFSQFMAQSGHFDMQALQHFLLDEERLLSGRPLRFLSQFGNSLFPALATALLFAKVSTEASRHTVEPAC
jgi:hypothetical protein